MNEIRYMNRIAEKYEKKFNTDSSDIRATIDFHIEQLDLVIKSAKAALDETGDNIQSWCETIQYVYAVDDANTWWKKLELRFMIWYVNTKYESLLRYSYRLNSAVERLENVRQHLMRIKLICR